MASDILPSEDLIDMKVCNNHHVSVCPCLFTTWNFKVCLFLNLILQIGGAAYLWVRLIHGLLWYFCARNSVILVYLGHYHTILQNVK